LNYPAVYKVKTEQETIRIADEFSSVLKLGEVVALKGDLGAGKTFFVKAVLKNMGITNVNSPSFAIVYEYSGQHKVNHFDFYRINKVGELFDIGFEEYISNNEAITFIEWADLFPEILPKHRIDIDIKIIDSFTREIIIRKQ